MNINREMVQRLVGCLALLLVALAGSVGSALPAEGQEMAPQGSEVYVEDFSAYTHKDYTENTEWDIWNGQLTVSLWDAMLQTMPATAPDGAGGAFVAWQVKRGGGRYIFAQRVDANGNKLWPTDVRVSSDNLSASQWWPSIGVDGSGDAIVVWNESRNGSREIYAQRLDAEGNRLWPTDVRVNSDSGTANQVSSTVAVDVGRNAVIVWQDERNGGHDIYAQRLDTEGNKLWPADVQVSSNSGTADQRSPCVGADAGGNAVVVWEVEHNDNWDIYAQRLDASGNKFWPADVQVNSPSGTIYPYSSSPSVGVDESGNAIVAWNDIRNGARDHDIYAQQLDVNGIKLWIADVRVNSDSGTGTQASPSVGMDGSGDAVVVWWDYRGGSKIYAQRLDTGGIKLWPVDVRVNSDDGRAVQNGPCVGVDGSGDAVVVWKDNRSGDRGIYTQRLNVNGVKRWVADVQVNYRSGTTDQDKPSVGVDWSGDATVVWADDRNGNIDIYAQRLGVNGDRLWMVDVRVNSDDGTASQYDPAVAVDQEGNAVVVWTDMRNDIYTQRLDTEGNKLWPADVRVNYDSMTTNLPTPSVGVDGSGNAVIVWKNHRNSNYNIYAQRLDVHGNKLWDTDLRVDSDSGTADQWDPCVGVDPSGNAVVVWEDERNGNWDIYAQRLDASGNKLWGTDLWVCLVSGTHYSYANPSVGVDGSGNAVVVWVDERNGNFDIYAQCLDVAGNKQWLHDLQVNSDSGSDDQYNPSVEVNSSGNAIVVWRDYRSSIQGDLYSQLLDMTGNRLWAGDLQVNSDSGTAYERNLSAGVNASGNVVVVWNDDRNSNDDIYAQRLNTVGTKQWVGDVQVVQPDFFYFPSGTAQSRSVDTTDDGIAKATLTADYQTSGGTVQFHLTNDGGGHWVQVTPGVTHVFTTAGSDLRWRVELTSDSISRHRTPVIEQIRIEYQTTSASGDDYEVDDTCAQAQPIAVNGAAQQHTFHDAGDADWAWFEATAGMTYIIQTAHTGPDADTVLELWDACGGSLEGRDDDAFASGSSLVWTCPTSGAYYVKVMNHDPNDYGPDASYDLSVRTYCAPNPVAIIAAGHNDSYVLQANINHAANQAYLTFLDAGFARSDVYYLNPNPNQDVDGNGSNDDIAAVTTVANVRQAIQTWARSRVGLGVPLFIYLIDHGNEDVVNADGNNDRVTAPELDLWLSNLEATSGCDMITVIIEACHSGSFIDVTQYGPAEISGHNRVVVASTSSQLNAFPSPQGAAFSDAFFTALGDNQDVWTAFRAGVAAVEATGRLQTPWLDDNGDAVYDTADGDLARSRGLAAFFGGGIPVIDWVQAGEVSEGGSATIQTQVRDDLAVADVTAVIYPPSYEEPAPGEIIPELDVPTMTLTLAGTNVYAGTSGVFTETGAYRGVVYAQDNEGNQAIPQWILVGEKKVYLPLVLR